MLSIPNKLYPALDGSNICLRSDAAHGDNRWGPPMPSEASSGWYPVGCCYTFEGPIGGATMPLLLAAGRNYSIYSLLTASDELDPIIRRIRDTINNVESYEPDEPKPDQTTIDTAEETITKLLPPIRKFAITDMHVFVFDGSIHFEWRNRGRLLSLTIPSTRTSKPYLYHHSDNPGIVRDLSATTFSHWIEWLIGQNTNNNTV